MTTGRSTALPAAPSEAPSVAVVARASVLNLVARLASGAAALATAAITTNVLDTYGRGIYAILTTCVGIAANMLTGGTTVLAADLIFGRRDERSLHGASLAVAAAAAVLLLPISLAVSLFTGTVTPAALVWAAAITVLVTYSSFVMSIDQARGDVRRVSLTTFGMAGFPFVAMAVSAALFDPTVTTLIAAWAIGALMTASVQFTSAIATGGVRLSHAWGVGASLIRRSLGVSIANGTMLLWSRIDIFVVAAVLSASAAGVYSIPVALSGSLLLVSRSLLTATYHSIMTAPETEVAGRLSAALRLSVIALLACGALSVPVVAVAASFVFGDAYSEIWRPYAVLVVGSACLCAAEFMRHLLLTRLERSRELVILSLVMLAVNGALAAGGAAWFGLVGAALATTLSYAVAALASVVICARALSVSVRELAVPRRSDLASFGRLARSLLGERRQLEESCGEPHGVAHHQLGSDVGPSGHLPIARARVTRFRRLLDDLRTALSMPRIDIVVSRGAAEEEEVLRDLRRRHPRYRIVSRKAVGAALLPLEEFRDREEYLATLRTARRQVRRAARLGYTVGAFAPDARHAELLAIHTSLPESQGRAIDPEYLDPEAAYPTGRHIDYLGAFRDDVLLAYCMIEYAGDIAGVSRIMGHGDDVHEGTMFLLMAAVVEHVKTVRPETRYLFYDMFFGAADGLREFKAHLGFRPYFVRWRRERPHPDGITRT